MIQTITRYFSILVLIGAPQFVQALSCAPQDHTLNEAYAAADSIIVGLVTECEEEVSSEPWANGGSGCAFTALEVLKDSSPQRDYSGMASSSGCGLSLRVGEQYLLYLNKDNRPMSYSRSLGGAQRQGRMAGRYLQILREFQNGAQGDLSEPWLFSDVNGVCSISHRVGKNTLVISRGSPAMVEQPKRAWTREAVNGETAYRTRQPAVDTSGGANAREVELTAYGIEPSGNTRQLTISATLREHSQESPPFRRATLSVDGKTWPLYRMEARFPIGASRNAVMVNYYAIGDAAEQIVSAMAEPSDIVVSAAMVATAAEPLLQMESRSTRLSAELQKFQACVEGR